ncbi:MAG: molybdenum cofactor guanylyltransferase [Chloroflexi bacterium]|nr:molybdenum cofactor guanylyltransferase [Chloroflexota bacterium]
MGKPKAFVYLGGQTLIERVITSLRPLFKDIYVVARSPEPFRGLGLDIVVDILRERGPAGGIHAGLSHSRTEWNFVVACDMPFINRELVAYMAQKLNGCDILLPRLGGRIEPLHGFYSRRVLSTVERMLQQGKGSVKELVARCKTKYIEEEEIRRLDPAALSIWSLNTPEALEAARRLITSSAHEARE